MFSKLNKVFDNLSVLAQIVLFIIVFVIVSKIEKNTEFAKENAEKLNRNANYVK